VIKKHYLPGLVHGDGVVERKLAHLDSLLPRSMYNSFSYKLLGARWRKDGILDIFILVRNETGAVTAF
jgi:hypothetical protein